LEPGKDSRSSKNARILNKSAKHFINPAIFIIFVARFSPVFFINADFSGGRKNVFKR